METRNLKIDIETARNWYSSGDEILKELSLKAFSVDELTTYFRSIKTFKDACKALKLDYDSLKVCAEVIAEYSKASAAMFKLNIIRKALNLGQELHFAKGPYVNYPCNPFVTEYSTYYNVEIKSGKMEIIGKIKDEGKEYNVLGGTTNYKGYSGVSGFNFCCDVGYAESNYGFLGCASKEIAQHFGKYFGMLITEAKYGDMADFEIINSKYPN